MATRIRKTVPASTPSPATSETPIPAKAPSNPFTQLTNLLTQLQEDYTALQKNIAATRENWTRDQQEQASARQREQETYDYETSRSRKLAEDDFTDRKT